MFPWLKNLFAEFTPRSLKATITALAIVGFVGYFFGTATVVTPKLAVSKSTEVSSPSEIAKPTIFVHIAGSVKHPGIYQLESGSRVYEAIQPELALISVGERNSYGHPTNRTLKMLDSVGAQVLRTDLSGAIGVTEAESGLTVSVSGRS